MSILDKLKKTSTIKETDILSESRFFEKKDMIPTMVPMLNVALSGRLDGGLIPGMTMFAGPSKHFKTAFSLMLVKAYLDKYDDAVILFYDSEFGAPQAYFETFGIDTSRVMHTPLTDMEQLKFDVTKQINALELGDHVMIVIDSIGNLASKKEAEDALDGKSVSDMSRAKQIKSVFRIITPHLNIKNIPLVVVNHTYKEQGLYPKDIVSGGTGPYYSADNIFIVGRQQEKDGTELTGYNFVINVEKSRFVREKSKISISVSFEGGISPWSGLMEVALESGHVVKPKNGWYQRVDLDTGEVNEKNYRLDDTNNKDFWLPILKSKSFRLFIEKKYTITTGQITNDQELLTIYGDT